MFTHFQYDFNLRTGQIQTARQDQTAGESIESYITCLYHIAETCEYRALKEEMLRDRLVVGISDRTMSQKLQMDADLTLEKAKKTVRQKEAVVQQHQELQGSKKVLDEIQPRDQPRHWEFQQNYMHKGGPNREPSQHNNTSCGNNKFQHQHRGGAGPNRINNYSKTCTRSGEPRHPTRSQCPALGVTVKGSVTMQKCAYQK